MVSYDRDSDLVVKASNLAGEIMEQAAKNGIVIPEAADRFKAYSDGYRLCCHIRKDQQGAEGEALMNRILTPGNPEYEFSARRAAIILSYVRDGKAIPDPLINPEYKDEAVEKAYKRGYYENYENEWRKPEKKNQKRPYSSKEYYIFCSGNACYMRLFLQQCMGCGSTRDAGSCRIGYSSLWMAGKQRCKVLFFTGNRGNADRMAID